MLDINLFRRGGCWIITPHLLLAHFLPSASERGGDPDLIRESQRRRFDDVSVVDEVIRLDDEWRSVHYTLEQLNRKLNAISKQVASLNKSKSGPTEHFLTESRGVKAEIASLEAKEAEALRVRDKVLSTIGNLVHGNVPISRDESDNLVLSEGGPERVLDPEPWMMSHPDLLTRLGIVNMEAAQSVSGGRTYYLLGQGVLLNQALINYALSFLVERGFEPVATPHFMRREVMSQVAQLADFDSELYRLSSSERGEGDQGRMEPPSSSNGEERMKDDKFLIATSEQPLCGLHRKSWIEAASLPLRYAGLSTCYRREAGSHGRDTLGIFRVHQFDKVEMFSLTHPGGDHSSREMEGLVRNAGDFYSSLEIPHRWVSVASGALNKAASIKHDLEGWFPVSRAYRELVSCSNCTDYQSRPLDIRLRNPGKGEGAAAAGGGRGCHVHLLNSTLTATQRTLSCLIENHQTKEGVRVPQPLRSFLGGIDFIPFKKLLRNGKIR